MIYGLIGVLIGAALASGYNHWSTRRSELEAALVSATLMCDEMRALIVEMGRSPAESSAQLARVASSWDERREALVLFLADRDFEEVGKVIRDARSVLSGEAIGTPSTETEALIRRMERLVDEFEAQKKKLRREHQAFIASALGSYLRGLAGRATTGARTDRHLSGDDPETELQ